MLAETVSRVHRGFKREVDDLWSHLEQILFANTKVLWSTDWLKRCDGDHLRRPVLAF